IGISRANMSGRHFMLHSTPCWCARTSQIGMVRQPAHAFCMTQDLRAAMDCQMKRCPWPTADDALYLKYHDHEWGVPVRNDRKIYEFLVLETFQAGLSWRTVLHKRENFRKAFASFDYNKVAKFGARERSRLIQDAGIIRNRAKIEAAVTNALA